MQRAPRLLPIWELVPAENRFPTRESIIQTERLLELEGRFPFRAFCHAEALKARRLYLIDQDGYLESSRSLPGGRVPASPYELAFFPNSPDSINLSSESLQPLRSYLRSGEPMLYFYGSSYSCGGRLAHRWDIDEEAGRVKFLGPLSFFIGNPTGLQFLHPRSHRSMSYPAVFGTGPEAYHSLPICARGARFCGDTLAVIGWKTDLQRLVGCCDVVAPLRYDLYDSTGELLRTTDLGVTGELDGHAIGGDRSAVVLIGLPGEPRRQVVVMVDPQGEVLRLKPPTDELLRLRGWGAGQLVFDSGCEIVSLSDTDLHCVSRFEFPAERFGRSWCGFHFSSPQLLSADLLVIPAGPFESPDIAPEDRDRTLALVSTNGEAVAELVDWPGSRNQRKVPVLTQEFLFLPGDLLAVVTGAYGIALYALPSR